MSSARSERLLSFTTLKWAVVAVILGTLFWLMGGGGSGPNVGKPAPDFTTPTLSGETFQLSEHHGRVIVLDFWATWCPPCRASLPALQRIHERYEHSDSVLIASVNIDQSDVQAKTLPAYMRGQRFTFPVLLDPSSSIGRLYSVKSIPTLVIVGANGDVHSVQVGLAARDVAGIEAALERKIEKALKATR